MVAMKTGLIADIGATNARFALAAPSGVEQEHVLKCDDFPTIVDAAKTYLDIVKPDQMPEKASFAIAGPITGDWFTMTNNLWSFSVNDTRDALGLKEFHLINDFEAIAMSIPHLKPQDMRQIGSGTAVPKKPIGVIGPGTGLGAGLLVWDGARYMAVQSEGGHMMMPARTQREFDIFSYILEHKYTHVSAERVCSGKGLVNLYDTMREMDKRDDLPARTAEEISAAALDGSCDLCAEILDLMCGFLGRAAKNMALMLCAQGGIYIAGGIINKLGDYFDNSRFREEYESAGRFREYLEKVPTFSVTNEYPAFVGLHADIFQD
jgi:glucokinase